MPAKQKITITTTKTRVKSRKRKSSGGKRGNNNRCPKCGRYI